MHRWLLAAFAAFLIVPSHAFAQAEAPYQRKSGGPEFNAPQPLALSAAAFSVAPGTVRSGTPVTVKLRIIGVPKRVGVRIALTPAGGGRAVGGIRLGRVRTGRIVTRSWRPLVAAGHYVARLQLLGGRLGSPDGTSVPVTVEPKPKPPPPPVVPTSSGNFPVQGQWSFGGDDARFGAKRNGHTHQGQDIIAAEGTPIVSPVPGTVYWRAVQAAGAGHYLVVRGDDGSDYVFMHLVAGSE